MKLHNCRCMLHITAQVTFFIGDECAVWLLRVLPEDLSLALFPCSRAGTAEKDASPTSELQVALPAMKRSG